MKSLRIFLLLILSSTLMFACSSGKPKAHYQPKRFHHDKKNFHKVSDVTTDHKRHHKNSAKYKNKQASYLKNINQHKNGQTDGVFYLY